MIVFIFLFFAVFEALIRLTRFFNRVEKTKKRLIVPGKQSAKKKKKKVLSKLEVVSKDGNDGEIEMTDQMSAEKQHHIHDVPEDGEGERIIRKSTRTAVINRQAEREAIRAALQATMKVCYFLG